MIDFSIPGTEFADIERAIFRVQVKGFSAPQHNPQGLQKARKGPHKGQPKEK